jgi:SAM-dependent methyltransferase
MHLDVEDLRDFYAEPIGIMVRRVLSHRIRARWRPPLGDTLIGLGYPTPYIGVFRSEVLRLGALMPAAQGALVWPSEGKTASVLVEEDRLPLPDNSVDRMLCIHALEVAERPAALLREIWRVMTPEGRLMMVVPNRRGVWARTDATPFGQGRPFSRGQLEALLTAALFTPVDWGNALHFPPSSRPVLLKSALTWERAGARLGSAFAGVIIVDAKKEMTAPLAKPATARVLRQLVTVRRSPAAAGSKS